MQQQFLKNDAGGKVVVVAVVVDEKRQELKVEKRHRGEYER